MAWKGLTLTLDGQSVLNNAQALGRMNIKSIVIGDGDAPANFRNLKGLVNKLYEITDLKIEMVDGQCKLTADFPQVDYDYTFREIGIIATTDDEEKLYAYDNCGTDAQRIISNTGVETTKKRIRLLLEISDVANITASAPSILYVAYDDFEENMDRIDASINGKVDKERGKGLSANDYTDQEKAKLQEIEEGANNYTHPATHPASMIDQDATHRFVTDLDKQEWGGAYAQATAYTDQRIAGLINGAPSTLDTLGEIAQAMQDNADVVNALNIAIGKKADAGHVHDDRYYTETEINNKLAGKANSSHTHTKSQIMDFPTSLPASDVYSWAKASSKPGYTWNEIGNKPASFVPSSHTHSYLPLTGGTITGNISMGKNAIQFCDGKLRSPAGQQLYIAASNEWQFELFLGVKNSMWTFCPGSDGGVRLGHPNYRWDQIYSSVSAISTSDRNKKKDINLISDKYLEFFALLRPVTYRFIDGASGRIHIGFIAQDVEAAMEQVGLSDLDFAGFCRDKVDENYVYSLRYEEFIALNTAVIQSQQQRIRMLEERMEKLELAAKDSPPPAG